MSCYGSKYFGKKEYSSKYADISILSFHAVKSITCGEGGALLTNIRQKDELAKLYRSHGVVKKSYHQLDMLSWVITIELLIFNVR